MMRCQPDALGRRKLTTPRESLERGVSEGWKEGMFGVCTARERTGEEVSDNK